MKETLTKALIDHMIEESTNLPTLKRVNKFSVKQGKMLPKQLKHSLMSIKNFFFVALAVSCFVFTPSVSQAQPDGEKLFKSKCATCHKANEKKLIGPGLKGATERLEMEWLIPWVQNSAALIKSGDSYANQIYEEYNKVAMTAFPELKDEDVVAIFAYVDEVNAAPVAGVAGGPEVVQEPQEPANNSWIYILALIVFGILLYILTRVKGGMEYALREKEGVAHPAPQTVSESIGSWINDNSKVVILVVIALLVMGSVDGWNRLAGIGVYQGYQPEQPIKFSHKLHAGINKIDCQYCHSGAEKSKHANIPSANVCMNCHVAINEGPQYGEEEIAKIYTALDYDPDTKEYGDNPQPIKWVRVHNLPDLAYFNHAQHVNVGQIECQECHGKIEEMEVVSQHSDLTMGWCIDCHRTTNVKMEGNAYYDELHAYLVEKHGEEAQITVDKIGGLECAKCHY